MRKSQSTKKHQPQTYKAEDYTYSVMWSDEDEAFLGRVVEFPSLAAHSNTQSGALREITKLVRYVLEDLEESGDPIPEPLTKKKFSGKLNLRMPSHLHRQLSVEASREGISLNQWINLKLSAKGLER